MDAPRDIAGLRGAPGNGETAGVHGGVHDSEGGDGGGPDAGQGVHTGVERLPQGGALLHHGFGEFERNIGDEDAGRVVAKILVAEIPQRMGKQDSGREQGQRNGELADDEAAAQAIPEAASGKTAVGGLQCGLHVDARGGPGRRQSEDAGGGGCDGG